MLAEGLARSLEYFKACVEAEREALAASL